MDKSIDLGKLQTELAEAHKAQRAARKVLDTAHTKFDNAAQSLETAKEKHRLAVEAVDKMRHRVVDASRTVANS